MITSFKEIKAYSISGNMIPVITEISSDLITPVAAYLRLTRPGKKPERLKSFLFESIDTIDGEQRPGRFSTIGINPICNVFIQDGKLFKSQGQGQGQTQVELGTGNPFRNIEKLMEHYQRSHEGQPLPPFAGGAVGYLGAECSQYVESVPVAQSRATPYDAHLILFRTVIVFDLVRQKLILIDHIMKDEETVAVGYRRCRKELQRIQTLLTRPMTLKPTQSTNSTDTTQRSSSHSVRKEAASLPRFPLHMTRRKRKFIQSVEEIKKYIRRGDLFQCVLSEQINLPFPGDPLNVYRNLRQMSPTPYLFYIDFGDEVLLGASPEMLIRVTDGKVEASPIAGTRRRGKCLKEDAEMETDLLSSEKEKAEHLMLVDLGRNDLGRICRPHTLEVNRFMEVQRFSNVMHLVSHLQGTLRPGRTSWDALVSCFPAGTLSGAPKVRALEVIAQLEPIQRGPYGGAVIFRDLGGNLDSCITIRSAFFRNGRGLIQAGAGIVADSNPDHEFKEILHKSKAIRMALEMEAL